MGVGGEGAKLGVHAGVVVHDAGRLRGLRENDQRAGTTGQQAHAMVPNQQILFAPCTDVKVTLTPADMAITASSSTETATQGV